MRTLSVSLDERSYPIHVGSGVRRRLPGVLDELRGVRRVVVVADERVAALHLDKLVIGRFGPPTVLKVPSGEHSKSLAQTGRLYDQLAASRVEREDVIVTFGGGMVGDLGGFVAATWLRGIRYVQVPTTLVAAIDASVGGKTGVNHAAGKNLIGAFHQPGAVLVDTDFLATLPQRDFVAGLGESVKHAAIRDPAFLEWHEQRADAIVARVPEVLAELIARNCEIKARVVAQDERERNLRAILNYGHTIGHAIEHLLEYRLRHGECVALGMLAANRLACGRGLLDRAAAERVAALLARLGLPLRLPQTLAAPAVIAACQMDKKVQAGRIRFVLLRGLGAPRRVADVTHQEIARALPAIQPR